MRGWVIRASPLEDWICNCLKWVKDFLMGYKVYEVLTFSWPPLTSVWVQGVIIHPVHRNLVGRHVKRGFIENITDWRFEVLNFHRVGWGGFLLERSSGTVKVSSDILPCNPTYHPALSFYSFFSPLFFSFSFSTPSAPRWIHIGDYKTSPYGTKLCLGSVCYFTQIS